MDNLKASANQMVQQANAGVAKLDNLPVNRRSDQLLRSLGVAVLAERTGRGNPGTGAEIDKLIAEIQQHEAQHNLNIVQQAAQAAVQAAAAQAQCSENDQSGGGEACERTHEAILSREFRWALASMRRNRALGRARQGHCPATRVKLITSCAFSLFSVMLFGPLNAYA